MNESTYAAKVRSEMEEIRRSMVEPGFSELGAYREKLARYHALKDALAMLRLTVNEDDNK